MHMSPRDLNLRRQWTKFVQVKRAEFVEPSKHSVICGADFASDCFEGDYMREMGFKMSTDLIPSEWYSQLRNQLCSPADVANTRYCFNGKYIFHSKCRFSP